MQERSKAAVARRVDRTKAGGGELVWVEDVEVEMMESAMAIAMEMEIATRLGRPQDDHGK